MVGFQYIWLTWASAFLAPWLVLFIAVPQHRRTMAWSSIGTAPFGLTEPLFVPEYWNPPSLFDLAHRTGFDIESLIFSFAIGGVGCVLYNAITGQDLVPVRRGERRHSHHRYHALALLAPAAAFPALYLAPWNPIYPAIVAMALGGVATVLCRPDLLSKTWVGALLFLGYYAVFMFGLRWSAPGYIDRIWNLDALSGFLIYGVPIEELLFAAAFGMYWAGIYEHLTWRRPVRRAIGAAGVSCG